jgi:hypothetical protein
MASVVRTAPARPQDGRRIAVKAVGEQQRDGERQHGKPGRRSAVAE